MQNHLYNDIFGESLEQLVQRGIEQAKLAKVTEAMDTFLENGNIGTTTQREHQTPTQEPGSVDEAKGRLLKSIDRFVAQAKAEARKGGFHAL
jgi:hypothetical protein